MDWRRMLVWRMKHAMLRGDTGIMLLIWLVLLSPFLLLAFAVWGCVYLARKKSSVSGKVVVIALFVLLFGSDIYAYFRWVNLCRTAGLFVYKTAEVNGYFSDDGFRSARYYEGRLKQEGFEYIEGLLTDSKPDPRQMYRFSLDKTGKLVYLPIDRPTSRYAYRGKVISNYTFPEHVEDFVDEIIDLESGQQIALHRWITTRGGPIGQLFSLGGNAKRCYGSGEHLRGKLHSTSLFINSALFPINRKTENAGADTDHAETEQLTCHNPDSAEGSCGFVEDDASNQ